jgi:hypothetical protein
MTSRAKYSWVPIERERERERGVELTGGGAVAKPAMASGMSGGWEGERNVSSSV